MARYRGTQRRDGKGCFILPSSNLNVSPICDFQPVVRSDVGVTKGAHGGSRTSFTVCPSLKPGLVEAVHYDGRLSMT